MNERVESERERLARQAGLCPVCRSPLRSLREFEVLSLGEFPGIGADNLSSNETDRALFRFVTEVCDFIGRKVGLKWRKRLLRKYPNSLVCARCLAVVKRA